MRKSSLLIAVFLIFVTSAVALAQEVPLDEYSECDLAGLSRAIVSSIETAGTDEAKLDAILGEAASAISRVQSACANLSFEGTNARLIGPIDLAEGYYRVRITTDGFFIAKPEVVSGNCNAGGYAMFNLMAGQASDGAEALVDSQGCRLLLAMDNVTDAWTLTFEKLE